MQRNVKDILERGQCYTVETTQRAVNGRVRINVYSPVDAATQRGVDMRLWYVVYFLGDKGVSAAVIDAVKEIVDYAHNKKAT